MRAWLLLLALASPAGALECPWVDGAELTSDLRRIEEVRREVGMVFQQFNLFPHLTILENCTLAPIWAKKGWLR